MCIRCLSLTKTVKSTTRGILKVKNGEIPAINQEKVLAMQKRTVSNTTGPRILRRSDPAWVAAHLPQIWRALWSLIENMQLFQWLRGEEIQYKQGARAQTLTGVLAIMNVFWAFMTPGGGPEPRECFSVNFPILAERSRLFFFKTVVLTFTR